MLKGLVSLSLVWPWYLTWAIWIQHAKLASTQLICTIHLLILLFSIYICSLIIDKSERYWISEDAETLFSQLAVSQWIDLCFLYSSCCTIYDLSLPNLPLATLHWHSFYSQHDNSTSAALEPSGSLRVFAWAHICQLGWPDFVGRDDCVCVPQLYNCLFFS